MDEETKELAALALRNQFWRDFSSLVNAYLKASAGLDVEYQKQQMAEMTSVYGRSDSCNSKNFKPSIWTQSEGRRHSRLSTRKYHRTILEALELETAAEVSLGGRRVFERRGGEWYFVG